MLIVSFIQGQVDFVIQIVVFVRKINQEFEIHEELIELKLLETITKGTPTQRQYSTPTQLGLKNTAKCAQKNDTKREQTTFR